MKKRKVAVLGSGPAALMVADVVSASGTEVTIFEKRKAPGRKLLIAGSSGLNITHSLPMEEFLKHYSGSSNFGSFGDSGERWRSWLRDFSPQDWLRFLEDLGMETFEGTSGRFFVREMKASKLLRAWVDRLTQRGVQFLYSHECCEFRQGISGQWILDFLDFPENIPNSGFEFDAVCFCLGGGSYEPQEVPLRWPDIFIRKQIGFDAFTASNAGYQVEWSLAFLKECEGLPLKNIRLISSRGSRLGDLVITRYGLEGTPVYSLGQPGWIQVDLKPDLSMEQILAKCRAVKENLSPLRRIKRQLSLCPAALGLLFHFTPQDVASDLVRLVHHLKNFPLRFLRSQPLDEAISSAGGLHMTELSEDLMFTRYPGIFAAGEMLNWDAPTGGFLIQGCVSQGYRAGHGILGYLRI